MDAAAAVAAVARQRCFGDIRVPEQALEAETVRLLWLASYTRGKGRNRRGERGDDILSETETETQREMGWRRHSQRQRARGGERKKGGRDNCGLFRIIVVL